MSDIQTLYGWIKECKRTIAIMVAVTALYGLVSGLIVILTGTPCSPSMTTDPGIAIKSAGG